MIINHRNRFIFIANRKTASTSIGIALSSTCQRKDVITPLSARDEAIRQDLGYLGPRNFIPWKNKLNYLKLRIQKKLTKKNINRQLEQIGFHTHIKPQEALQYLNRECWETYFKFCFVRNPWDRAISQYFWVIRGKKAPMDLDTFINSRSLQSAAKNSKEMYTINGKFSVDRICNYENVQEEVNQIFEELNLSGSPKLPETKRQFRSDHRHYRDILNDGQAARIASLFKHEIELAGYSY